MSKKIGEWESLTDTVYNRSTDFDPAGGRVLKKDKAKEPAWF